MIVRRRAVEERTEATQQRELSLTKSGDLGEAFRAGENRDSAWYSIVDDEWPRVRVGLEARLADT